MPSSYSQSLRLELIATGEQSGTWGQTTDTNMQLIEQGIAGWGYPVFGADADLSVLISDAMLSPGRAAILWVTASVTLTAPRNLILSSVPKTWIVHNATTQWITVKTAAGVGPSIPPNARQQVLCDGVNMIAGAFTVINAAIAGSFVLSGVLYPPQITTHMADYNPAGLADTAILRVWSNSPTWGILGLAGGAVGRIITMVNAGSVPILLYEEHAASVAANRFLLGIPIYTMPPNGAVTLFYDMGNLRWRMTSPTVDTVPVGTVLDWPTNTLPPRCIWAAGQYLDQTYYARLYAAYGGTWGVSGSSFAVPDLRGRVTAGRDDMGGTAANRLTMLGGLGGAGGEQTHVITGNELPYHKHGIYDPGHAHSIADNGHNHNVGNPAHYHPLNDPGHVHGVGDPPHAHPVPSAEIGAFGGGGSLLGGGGSAPHGTAGSGTGVYLGASGTGAYADWVTTGIYLAASGTGIGIYGSGTGVDTYYAGANWGMSLLQPTMIMNKIIYAGV
jgi:microcystin-dependent protein